MGNLGDNFGFNFKSSTVRMVYGIPTPKVGDNIPDQTAQLVYGIPTPKVGDNISDQTAQLVYGIQTPQEDTVEISPEHQTAQLVYGIQTPESETDVYHDEVLFPLFKHINKYLRNLFKLEK